MPHDEPSDQKVTEQHHAAMQRFFTETHTEAGKQVQPQDLITMRPETIGVGAFSRIRLIEVNPLRSYLVAAGEVFSQANADLIAELHGVFALKVVRKTEVVRLKQTEHMRNESLIHAQMSHPFLCTLFHRYQDERNLYFVQEFVQCGPLFQFIQLNGRLPNDTARYFAAQVVMAVQYLHSEHIAYRDLNPENVMLDRGCYVKLIDFGLAKVINFDDPMARTWTLCGKPEYLAPEIITSKGHSKEVDWWALGILIHEMLAGYPPFYDRDAFKIYQAVLTTRDVSKAFPVHFEQHGRDLVKKLLTKDRAHRIGSSKNGAEDIKKHKWFRGLNWAALYNKQLVPPIGDSVGTSQPSVGSYFDTVNFAPYPTSAEENGPMLDTDKDQTLFGNWATLSSATQLQQRS